mmetsp:Transcript_59448/g.125947  ORF Transcript_59448/g.125947 Transcript_59448/m.125947 type:complete len:238 (-) Transcript_59448:153-866(-)
MGAGKSHSVLHEDTLCETHKCRDSVAWQTLGDIKYVIDRHGIKWKCVNRRDMKGVPGNTWGCAELQCMNREHGELVNSFHHKVSCPSPDIITNVDGALARDAPNEYEEYDPVENLGSVPSPCPCNAGAIPTTPSPSAMKKVKEKEAGAAATKASSLDLSLGLAAILLTTQQSEQQQSELRGRKQPLDGDAAAAAAAAAATAKLLGQLQRRGGGELKTSAALQNRGSEAGISIIGEFL